MGSPDNHSQFPIVGIGASAGGLEAFTQLLRAMPVDTGMAFVLVQHLAPTHLSHLAEILSRATDMPVVEVQDEPIVESNHVYVIPPGRDMTISGGVLKLLPRTEVKGQHKPIDHFLRSLAKDQGERAIGVILSGTANDGTIGLEEIKAEGGITFAQDATAQQDSMPRSAVGAGCVDFVLPPDQISKEIARIAQHPSLNFTGATQPSGAPAAGQDMGKILKLLRTATGADFTHYKVNTLYRRITRRMVLHKLESLDEFAQLLREDPRELEILYQDILIGVTSFFRDPEMFKILRQDVFPKLIKERSRNDPLRIWVLGCSTGEEAYSLAIAYTEFAQDSACNVPLQLFATDINTAGIEKARTGLYSKNTVQEVSPERLRRFFVEADGHYRVTRAIRERCIFAQHNILSTPPFSRMDLVSCRNLLIYLEAPLQAKVLPLLHYALNPDGVLVLGTSETIGAYRDLFDMEDAKNKIYVRRPGQTHVIAMPAGTSRLSSKDLESSQGQARIPSGIFDIHKEAERTLLAKYAPPGVLVNAELEILQFRGDTAPYLTPPPGRPSLNLLKMAREGLLTALNSAVRTARKEKVSVREEGLRVQSNGGSRDVSLEVIPVRDGESGGFLVLFEDASPQSRSPNETRSTNDASCRDPMEGQSAAGLEQQETVERENTRLVKELAGVREYLQSIIEQQEAANEELQSANEEVQSSNEELQSINEELETSKEEIQSSNEELATVNDELQNRNFELNVLSNDLRNLLSSVHMPIVMLGSDLRIRRFTPIAEKLLNLIPSDLGRPISDIRLSVSISDLESLLLEVIDTVSVRESEVQDKDGRWYSVRIRPYKTLENKIEGAVLLFVDIDAIKRARQYAENIVATVREPLLVLDTELRIQTASQSFYDTFKISPQETEDWLLYSLGRGQWNIPALRKMLEEVLTKNHSFDDFLVQQDFEHIGHRTLLLNARRLQEPERSELILLAIQDVTERKALIHEVEKLAAADRVRNEFLAMLAHELRNPLAPLLNVAQVLRQTPPDQATFQHSLEIIDRQTKNMARLIDDLLSASRINLQKVQLKKEPVDLATIISRAEEELRSRFETRQQHLTISLPKNAVYLDADPTRLEQVFANLLDNASKFSQQGGHIELTANLEPSKAEGNSPAEEVVVRIRDQGIGIPREILPEVFDLFVQGESSLQRKRGGLGVGLTIARGLVELHGGRIEAHSLGLDQGSEFAVHLPTSTSEPKKPTMDALHSQSTRSTSGIAERPRILIVDDNPDVVDTLTVFLTMEGYEVHTADSGPEALATISATQPDVVLLDIGLPEMDGYEVAREIRQQPNLEKIQLIAVTGYGSEKDRRLAREAGFDHHLTKPVDPYYLKEFLENGLNR